HHRLHFRLDSVLAETSEKRRRRIEMTNVLAPHIHELPQQTTRRVHRLPAILLRRWQAEEIAKTPFPCVSGIFTKHKVQINRLKNMLGDRLNKTKYDLPGATI